MCERYRCATSLFKSFCSKLPGGRGTPLFKWTWIRVCYSFVTRMSVHKYSNNFRVHALACLANFSERISSFLLSPDFLDHLAKKRLPLPWRRADYKGCLLFFRHTIKTCQEKLFDWLIIQSLVWVTYTARQDFTVHSQSLIPLIVNKSAKIFEKYLVSELFHGYKDLARQSSWWSILFCVYVYIHWS